MIFIIKEDNADQHITYFFIEAPVKWEKYFNKTLKSYIEKFFYDSEFTIIGKTSKTEWLVKSPVKSYNEFAAHFLTQENLDHAPKFP